MLRHYRFDQKGLFSVLILPAFIVLFSTFALAQGGGVDTAGTGGRHSINGRLVFPSGQRADLRLKVRLESSGAGDLTVLSDNNGSFGFQNLVPGNYTVVVEGGEYFESVREPVFIESAAVTARRVAGSVPIARPFTVQVYLREKPGVSTKPGVLNAALAKVPKPAREHYDKALEFLRQGDSERAIGELKLAIELYPDFGLALNELGVQYLRRGALEQAAEALQKVIIISPDEVEPRLNYGIVLVNQKKFAEAETQLREVLKHNNSVFTAHVYLGISLSKLNKATEAETQLKKAIEIAGPKAGMAHYYLGGLYWQEKSFKLAADELEQYLKLEPKAANAERVRNTIKELRSKSEQ
jgi:tetratricopeptide (TPR) repeat protein